MAVFGQKRGLTLGLECLGVVTSSPWSTFIDKDIHQIDIEIIGYKKKMCMCVLFICHKWMEYNN